MDKHVRAYFEGKRPSSTEIKALMEEVYLQIWTYCAHRTNSGFWIVKKNGSVAHPVMEPTAHEFLQGIYNKEHKHFELQTQNGSSAQSTAPPTFVSSRPWMDRTKWDTTYNGLRRDVLATSQVCLPAMPITS
ncbi:hypothetical protein F5884DRAFT_813073 [Xylogone sp. PMI_703]|nr:hypothetical protein F5884DRAFT_813073 [Xylogone sp. PMI_703]